MVERWHQLPLDHALSCAPIVRELIAHLALDTAVPDLGPGVLMDQLSVLVYDACAGSTLEPRDLADRLAALRQLL